MDRLARLTERQRVHVVHRPGQVGRDRVVLAVDDVADAADGEAKRGGGADGVQDLAVVDLVPTAPEVPPEQTPEDPAPLVDAALVDEEGPLPRAGELLVV